MVAYCGYTTGRAQDRAQVLFPARLSAWLYQTRFANFRQRHRRSLNPSILTPPPTRAPPVSSGCWFALITPLLVVAEINEKNAS
jgi:hypothetical protein